MSTIKKTPQRTCIACRGVGGKRGLVRIVRLPDGRVMIDSSGRKPGRGAYLCREMDCLAAVLKGNQIEHAFKLKMNPDDREALTAGLKELIEERAVA